MRHSLCLVIWAGFSEKIVEEVEFWQTGEKGKVFGKGTGCGGGCRGAFQSRELAAMDQAQYP